MTEKFLLIASFFFGVVLFGTLNKDSGGSYDFRTKLDARIPFLPFFSLPYLFLFPYITFAAAALFSTEVAAAYYAAMAIAMCSAALVWFMFPSKMARPAITGKNFFEGVVYRIYEGDSHANAFPSSHVFTALITSYFLSLVFPSLSLFFWTTGITVAVSTVFIKQHFAVDVLAGAAWAYASISLALIYFG